MTQMRSLSAKLNVITDKPECVTFLAPAETAAPQTKLLFSSHPLAQEDEECRLLLLLFTHSDVSDSS